MIFLISTFEFGAGKQKVYNFLQFWTKYCFVHCLYVAHSFFTTFQMNVISILQIYTLDCIVGKLLPLIVCRSVDTFRNKVRRIPSFAGRMSQKQRV